MEGDDHGTPEQRRAEALTQAAQATSKKDGDTAIQLWVKCCALSRIIFGDTHMELARCHVELASVYLELKGYWEQALSHAVKGRDILQLAAKRVRSGDVGLSACFYHCWACCIIGRVQTAHGQLKEAMMSLHDAEMMCGECSKAIGSDSGPSPQTDGSDGTAHSPRVTMATVFRLEEDISCAFGRLAFKQKNFELARSYFTKAVDHHISHHGNGSEGLIPLLRELARTEGYYGNRPAAVKALSTALDISSSKRGEEAEEVAQLCRALASVHLWTMKEALMLSSDDITSPAPVTTQLSTEDAGEVERLLRRAQGIMSSVLGEDHYEAIECKEDLARFLLLASRHEEAVSVQRDVVRLKKKAIGTMSREVAYSYKLLGTAYMSAGVVEKSRKCFEKAMNIYSSVLGENHRETVCVLRSLDLIAGFGFSDYQDPLHKRPQFRTVV